MTCTRVDLDYAIKRLGAPVKYIPRIGPQLKETAEWCFVREQVENDDTKLIREALLEYDSTGQLTFKPL